MRQLLLITSLFLSLPAFSQQFTYSFKCEGVTDIGAAKQVSPAATAIFDAGPAFNEATFLFVVKSDIEISEANFIHKMENNGFTITLFIKDAFKNEEEDK